MIEIRPANLSDLEKINKLLKETHIETENTYSDITNYMVVYDQGSVIAAASFIQKDAYALIQFISVTESRRGEHIGEGLVKALLNFADKKGIKRVIANSKEHVDFLIKIGFKDVSGDQSTKYKEIFANEGIINLNPIIEAALPEYFKHGCKSAKNS